MAWPQTSLYTGLEALFAARTHARDATAAAAGGASVSESGSDFVEVAVTPEELPPELKEALSRTLALVAGTTNARDTRRILQDHYAKFALYETNLLWCPHSVSIAAWMGAARLLLMPYVEGIRCHRIVLRRVPAAGPSSSRHHTSTRSSINTLQGWRMQMDVTFAWRPLAPLHSLLSSWGSRGLQLPVVTTEHTITLTVDAQSRVVVHRDVTHNFPSVPALLKGVLGLPTPLIATVLHV